jgi:hypothetical protein
MDAIAPTNELSGGRFYPGLVTLLALSWNPPGAVWSMMDLVVVFQF